ncbi:MAG: alpha/beta hydrolase [Atopobiaceae bacterium]|nr:alpha/beta hydrolase [Atopobiaceae bacterium]
MGYLNTDGMQVIVGSDGPSSPAVFVIDSPDHPLDVTLLAHGRRCTIVMVPASNWNESLTPWPAPALYREEPPFGGKAAGTLTELIEEAMPFAESRAGLSPQARAICGYSLGGLFALYAFTHSTAFTACACLSSSVWYEGWVDHLRSLDLQLSGHFAYLSLGTKERRGALPIMRTVQDNMEACTQILRSWGCTTQFELGPGNHFQHVNERFEAGLSALDEFLCTHRHGNNRQEES